MKRMKITRKKKVGSQMERNAGRKEKEGDTQRKVSHDTHRCIN